VRREKKASKTLPGSAGKKAHGRLPSTSVKGKKLKGKPAGRQRKEKAVYGTALVAEGVQGKAEVISGKGIGDLSNRGKIVDGVSGQGEDTRKKGGQFRIQKKSL